LLTLLDLPRQLDSADAGYRVVESFESNQAESGLHSCHKFTISRLSLAIIGVSLMMLAIRRAKDV
jgi:hypothetical protein